MENANSRDYLEKIKVQVIENLRQTAHAPSVQATDVPRTDMLGNEDADDIDAELDDEDEDTNMDARTTERRQDKQIEKDNEFYDSDEENQSRSNGNAPQNGQRKRRNIMDYQNANAASDVEMDSGIPSPTGSSGAAAQDTAVPAAAAAVETNATATTATTPNEGAAESTEKEDVVMGDTHESTAAPSPTVAEEQIPAAKEKSKEPEPEKEKTDEAEKTT